MKEKNIFLHLLTHMSSQTYINPYNFLSSVVIWRMLQLLNDNQMIAFFIISRNRLYFHPVSVSHALWCSPFLPYMS